LKTTTDLVSKFVNQEKIDNWGDTCTFKLTFAYLRNEQPCLLIHDGHECNIYTRQGFHSQVRPLQKNGWFDIKELEQTHGIEIYKALNAQDFLLPEQIRELILKNTKDYFWAFHQETQQVFCVVRDGDILSFHFNKILMDNWRVPSGLTVQEFLDMKNIEIICPG
jgi:hypothetical protein